MQTMEGKYHEADLLLQHWLASHFSHLNLTRLTQVPSPGILEMNGEPDELSEASWGLTSPPLSPRLTPWLR